MSGRFATAINCMDGRTQLPVIQYIKESYGADYVDAITEAGPNKILAQNTDKARVESIKSRVEISVGRHESRLVAVVGHHDCAGNPADKAAQMEHIAAAVKTVRGWELGVEVIGLWVDEDWQVRRV